MCGKRTHEHDACGVGGNGRPGERRGVGGEDGGEHGAAGVGGEVGDEHGAAGVGGEVGGEHGAVGVGGEVGVQELEEEGDGEGGG